ncbi:LssY C-terminal domain-containing protein [bacterium]|nr:LssY C-terminal domain-containing protein [bacterium]
MIPTTSICLLLIGFPSSPDTLPSVTQTKDGRAGDPVNLRLVGSRQELISSFRCAGWAGADPINVRSSVRIGASVVLDRPYPSAPVSDLYLFGRRQDIAFERAVGGSARTRHHVRFWQAGCTPEGKVIWIGAGTFDVKVGRSSATGKLTHRIAPDVDTERDTILSDLERSGRLKDRRVTALRQPCSGRNGEGDCYYTDGGIGEGSLFTGGRSLLLGERADCGPHLPTTEDR